MFFTVYKCLEICYLYGLEQQLLCDECPDASAALTGFPTLLMSNCRGTPFGIFFSTFSTTTEAEGAAGGCSVQAVGGLEVTQLKSIYEFRGQFF